MLLQDRIGLHNEQMGLKMDVENYVQKLKLQMVLDKVNCIQVVKHDQIFLMLQQYDLSIIVFLKIQSIYYYCGWCYRKRLFPRMKLSMSTTLHCPNRYLPSHQTSVSSLYLDQRGGGATISFSNTTKCSQVLSQSGMGSQSTESLTGVLTRTNSLITIFSQPLYIVLLVQGLANFQLSQVKYRGVNVVRPNSLSQAQR